MPLFTAIGAALFGAGTFLAGATAFVLQAAAGVGLNLIAAAIKGKPKQEPVGIQGKLTGGGDVPRSIILGRYNTAGSLVYRNTHGKVGDTPNAYYVEVRALADFPVNSFPEVWVDGALVTLVPAPGFAAGWLTATQYIKHGTKWGDIEHLWFRFYDGTQTSADSVLTNWFGSSERPYGADRVGRGVPYVIIVALRDDLENENPLFNGFPQCKFTLNGAKLYDPSKDSTVGGSGSHRWSNPATWGGDGDNLPAVQIYNILRGITWNGKWLYGLQSANPAILPVANWIAAINKCRTLVAGPNGSEPQYRSGIQINVDVPPADVIEALLKTCNGRLSEVGGVYTIHVGEPDTPVLSFSDSDILSTEEQVYNPFRGLADSINGAVAKYPEPREGWNVKTSPTTTNPAQIARDGSRELFADVDLSACPYTGQVQRLLKSAMLEALRERRHTIVLPPWAQVLEPGDVVQWTSARNGYIDKWLRIDGMAYKANLDVMLQLTEVDPSDYDWDQDEDYVTPTFSPMEIIRPAPQPIIDWYAEGQIVYDAVGLPRRVQVFMSWDGSKSDVNGISYEISQSASASAIVVRGQTDDAQRGSIVVGSQSFIPGSTVYARGRYIPSSPRATEWSDWLPAILPKVNYGLVDFDAAVQKQVTEIVDDRFSEFQDQFDLLSKTVQEAMARTSIDKREVRTQLAARSDFAVAEISRVEQVAVDTEAAVAHLEETVGAEFNDVKASVTESANAIATLNGWAAASWGVQVDVDGNAIGLLLFNDSSGVNGFGVTADNFFVSFPGQAGGAKVPVFNIGNVNGVAKLALRGDMIIDGQVIARMIAAGQVKAVHIESHSIDTDLLAIGGVDFNAILDGATSRTYTGGVTTGVVNGTVYDANHDIRGGRVVCFANVQGTRGISFLIDEVSRGSSSGIPILVKDATDPGNFGKAYYASSSPPLCIATANGLSNGLHRFRVVVGGELGDAGTTGGSITILNLRR